jgi:hypothetical protein
MVPDISSAYIEKFLTMGLLMSQEFEEPNIFLLMFLGTETLVDIITQDQTVRFTEALEKMDVDTARVADKFTNGDYSQTRKALEATTSKLSDVTNRAVLGLHSKNMSPEEISSTMEFELAEVLRILQENGKMD